MTEAPFLGVRIALVCVVLWLAMGSVLGGMYVFLVGWYTPAFWLAQLVSPAVLLLLVVTGTHPHYDVRYVPVYRSSETTPTFWGLLTIVTLPLLFALLAHGSREQGWEEWAAFFYRYRFSHLGVTFPVLFVYVLAGVVRYDWLCRRVPLHY